MTPQEWWENLNNLAQEEANKNATTIKDSIAAIKAASDSSRAWDAYLKDKRLHDQSDVLSDFRLAQVPLGDIQEKLDRISDNIVEHVLGD